jgi:hypothetical protein
MSSTIRPDNLRAALDAKLAAAMSRLVELREAEEPHVTPHLNPREVVAAFLLPARGVYEIADTFGKAQVGGLQFNAWYEQWMTTLGDADRALWNRLRDDRARKDHGHGADFVDVEISVAADPSISGHQSPHRARADVRKQLVRFAAEPNRAASDVCADYLRLAKRFVDDFVRDHSRFLP